MIPCEAPIVIPMPLFLFYRGLADPPLLGTEAFSVFFLFVI